MIEKNLNLKKTKKDLLNKLENNWAKEEERFNILVDKLIKEKRKYFVVCRNAFTDELFYIQFKNKEQMERFILKNHGNVDEDIGFYAKAFADYKFYDENT